MSLSRVRLFATPRTVVHGILQAGILEWVAFSKPLYYLLQYSIYNIL